MSIFRTQKYEIFKLHGLTMPGFLRAFTTISAVICAESDQPTTIRVFKSMTFDKYSHPSFYRDTPVDTICSFMGIPLVASKHLVKQVFSLI